MISYMKQSLVKSISVVMLCFVITTVSAGDNSSATDYSNWNNISAHVSDMFRYGEFQTALFSGRLQVSIPIYKIDDPDFKMDIALHYNADGFKPRKHSGYVGYNWFLEAGGCITREVKGCPDEIYGMRSVNYGLNYQMGIEGMYHFIASEKPGWDKSKDEIFALPHSPQTCYWAATGEYYHSVGDLCDGYYVDYTPDIFHFNFLGYSGSFMINNRGEVQIISGDYVDVDLSGILADWSPRHPDKTPNSAYPMYPKKNSTITIRTKDGYTYVFGGDLSRLEYTVDACNWSVFAYQNFSQYYNLLLNPPTVSTWHLAEIIAPNKRTVTFHYKPAVKSEWFNILGDETPETIPDDVPGTEDPLWEFNECFDRYSWYFNAQAAYCDQLYNYIHFDPSFNHLSQHQQDSVWCVLNSSTPPYTRPATSYMYSATKSCILDSIQISGEQPLSIIFDNSLETTEMYNKPDHYGENRKKNFQLDSVRILSASNTIKTANLSYNYKGCQQTGYSFNWRFLSTVNISGMGSYQMTYYDGSFPNLYENATTYASQYDYHTAMSSETDDYGYYVSSNHSLALLQKIEYPTGGEQTYLYGKYAYNKKRKYSIVQDTCLEMNTVTENGILLGARINEVKTFENGNLIETKTYSYSDGIFFDNLKVYNMHFIEDYATPEYGWPVQCDANYGLLDTHVGYGKVIETTTNSQGTHKTIYKFDTGTNSYSSRNDTDLNGMYQCDNYNNLRIAVLVGQMFYSSQLSKWGKLISIENYESDNNLVEAKNYEYNSISNFCTDTIVIFGRYYMGQAEIARKLYVYPDVLTKEITKEYSDGDSLITTRTYSYDRKLRVTKETIDDSRGIQHFTKYTYPDNLTFNIGMIHYSHYPSIYLLKLKHQINNPIEVFSGYLGEDSIEYVTSGKINLYATGMFLSLIDNNPSSPAHIPPFIEIGDSINLHIYDSIANPIFELNYYPYLHKTLFLPISSPLLDYQPIVASGTTLIYDSYYKTEAEFKFDHMGRLLSHKPLGGIETKYTWNGIYPATKTIGDMTWAYTHIPHVGVQSITDPRGITTYYDYDEQGRLVKEYQIINNKEQILNVYQYHVKTE